ncbi:MAG: MoaD/ThiS family protein [Planctomycetes bacterium]|nr:MoaD/ThiS family protein [Planctomycetota bacterium]MCK5578862.1 MoaD/ThiS family protein [Planctomycetota bacterium]
MKIKLGGYGVLKNYVGPAENGREIDIAESKPIKDIIKEMNIPDGMVMLISVNDEQKNFDYLPQEGDDIKLIPPISGG